jgi:excinuclease UvrABC nuclease subunit
MIAAADDLRFEYAAQLRDELRELRRDLREIHSSEAPAEPDGANAGEPAASADGAAAREAPTGDIA